MPNIQERYSILQAISTKIPVENNELLHSIAKQTWGYTGADLQGLLYSAQLEAIHERMEQETIYNENVDSENDINFIVFDGHGVDSTSRDKCEPKVHFFMMICNEYVVRSKLF